MDEKEQRQTFLKIVFRKVKPRWGEREHIQLCGPTLPLEPQVPPVSRREPRFLVICSEAPRGAFPTCCSAPYRSGDHGGRWSEEPCCRWGGAQLVTFFPGCLAPSSAARLREHRKEGLVRRPFSSSLAPARPKDSPEDSTAYSTAGRVGPAGCLR